MTYTVEFDTIDYGYFVDWIEGKDFSDVAQKIKNILGESGGGHADIYDEDDNFIEDVEI